MQKKVTNGCGPAIFVPTNSSAEWTAFQNNKPGCVTVENATPFGYFYLTAQTYMGNFKNPTPNEVCLTDAINGTWTGKADAAARGLLVQSKVRAWLCTGSSCTMGMANTTYKFAAGDSYAGGASFTTDGAGDGPFDAGMWSDSQYFGTTSGYWTGRTSANANNWGATPSGAHCGDWYVGSSGTVAFANGTGNGRFGMFPAPCTGSWRMICLIDP